jgi:O-methyltransferase
MTMDSRPDKTSLDRLEIRKAAIISAHGDQVISGSTYQPWTLDSRFMELSERVRAFTLVDTIRCHELWSLVAETAKIEGDILEVGVWRGGTGCIMAARAQMLGRKGDVFLCDTFRGVVKAGVHDDGYSGGEHADTDIEIVNQLLVTLGVRNCILLPGIFPDETGPVIASRRFSLCHIDVDVHESARVVFDWVWPRMGAGGVVVFDDYGFRACPGITMLCDDLRARQDLVFVHNLNGHAVLVKTAA